MRPQNTYFIGFYLKLPVWRNIQGQDAAHYAEKAFPVKDLVPFPYIYTDCRQRKFQALRSVTGEFSLSGIPTGLVRLQGLFQGEWQGIGGAPPFVVELGDLGGAQA